MYNFRPGDEVDAVSFSFEERAVQQQHAWRILAVKKHYERLSRRKANDDRDGSRAFPPSSVFLQSATSLHRAQDFL
jgi:hypothetical protein